MKIWERHLLSRLFIALVLIMSGLFGIFVVIDLSIHSVRFFAGNASAMEISLYYLHCFSLNLDLFFSLGFLLSALKVLFDFTHHSEFVALQMAGLSNQRLTRPLFILAIGLALFSFANAQFLAPTSHDAIDAFRSEHAKRKKHSLREHVHPLTLDDGSEIVYQRFCKKSKSLFDVYWIRSQNELWHMKILELSQTPLLGHFVDCLSRNTNGQLVKTNSYQLCPLPNLPLSAKMALQKFTPFEQRPLLTLLTQNFSKSADRKMISAHLHYKLSRPFLSLLIALALPPVVLRFSRHKPTFLIAACALFALIALLTILDGMLILAENGVTAPMLALWTPWIASLTIATRQFLKF